MKSIDITIQDKEGLHARPAGILSKAAKGFESKVTMTKNGKVADMKKIFAVLALLALAACGGSSAPPPPVATATPSRTADDLRPMSSIPVIELMVSPTDRPLSTASTTDGGYSNPGP